MADAGTQVPEQLRVYLLDDHEIVRRGLRELLEAEGDIVVVGESGSAQEATRQIPACGHESPSSTGGCRTGPVSTSVGRFAPGRPR